MAKTSTGLEENVAGLLCYVLGWVSGAILLLVEPQNPFVRFHAAQSIVVFGVATIAAAIISWLPVVSGFLGVILGLASFVLWVVLMIKAYQGKRYRLPWAGNIAARWAGD